MTGSISSHVRLLEEGRPEMKIAHAGHAELRVKNLAASRRFFTEIMGLFVTDEESECVYLRAWQDWEHHTLILRQGDTSALEHLGGRVEDAESLEQFASRFEEAGIPYRWIEAGREKGQGKALRFCSPSGIPLELYWEMEKFRTQDPGLASALPSFPYRYPLKGIAPRRFDHFNVMSNHVAEEQEWFTTILGLKHRYYIEGTNGLRNGSGSGGRLHHVAYYVDSPDELLRAATVLVEHGGKIEWGPGKHGTSGATFLYFFEPSGHRLELWTGGMLIFSPDWEPIRWDQESGRFGFDMWGTSSPDSFLTYGSDITQSAVTGASTLR